MYTLGLQYFHADVRVEPWEMNIQDGCDTFKVILTDLVADL